jgi:hypothetical protein
MTILQLQIKQDSITEELLKVLQPYSKYFDLKTFKDSTSQNKKNSEFVDFFRNSPLVDSDIDLTRDKQKYQARIEF